MFSVLGRECAAGRQDEDSCNNQKGWACGRGVSADGRRRLPGALRSRYMAAWDEISHPLHQEFASAIIPRSGRMRLPAAHTNRHKNSFVSKAIIL